MNLEPVTLTARYIFPINGSPLERGSVTVAGERIVAVDPSGMRVPDFDCGEAAIVPGFVNAHTHLDLTGARGQTPPQAEFTDWLQSVIAFRSGRETEVAQADVRSGIAECVRFGTTAIGDIAFDGLSTDALLGAPLRSVVFRELIGVSVERIAAAWERFHWWRDAFPHSPTCKAGVSPHAPYSVNQFLYFLASISGLPLATHIAESPHEAELLTNGQGPFAEFLSGKTTWQTGDLSPNLANVVERACRAERALLIHANYLPANIDIPGHATIVYCPRTHAAFGHAPHPFRQFMQHGVRVALGTDSLASNSDLDMLAEARFVYSRNPCLSPSALLRMATLNGAEALGFADVTGSLDVGKSADFAIVDLPVRDAADPHTLLFASDRPVLATVFCGQRQLVDNGPANLPGLPLPKTHLR